MKTPVLVAVVVMLHVAAIGSLFFIQGCGTTKAPATPPPAPQMPPPVAPRPMPPPETVRPLPPPRHVPAPAPAPVDTVEYVVKAGDTLSKIAAHHKAPVKQIMDLNKISDPNKIRIGQKLIIPVRPGVTLHKPAKSAATPKKPAVAGTEYVVQAGDTLGAIAHRFGTKVAVLRELNKLEGDKILVGQKLVVSGDKAVESKAAAPAPQPAPVVEAPATPAPAPASAPVEEGPELAAPAAPDSASADASAAAPSEQEIIHTVMPNEDLDYIARLYVVSVDQIVKLNNLPERSVQVGQRLRIP